MAYPVSITGIANDANLDPYGFKTINRGGALYHALYLWAASPAAYIAMYKSTDNGNTWTEQDAANHPRIGYFTANFRWATVADFDDGVNPWFVYCPGDGPNPPTESRVIKFNIATGLWGTPITGGPVPTPGGNSFGTFFTRLGLVVRSDGTIVVGHTYIDTYRGTRATVYNGATWGSPIGVFVPWASTSGSEEYAAPYEIIGMTLGAGDRVHFIGATDNGYCYACLETTGVVTNFRRFDEDNKLNHMGAGPRYSYLWAHTIMATLCDTPFIVIPVGHWTESKDAPSNSWKPGILMIEDTAAPFSAATHILEEQFRNIGNWSSVAVAQDPVTKFIYLVWSQFDSIPSPDLSYMRMSTWKGMSWSTPVTLFFIDYPTYNVPEEIDITVENGVMRMTFTSVYDVWYWQGSVTGTAVNTCTGTPGPASGMRSWAT